MIKKNWKFFLILGISILLITMLVNYICEINYKLYDTTEKKEGTSLEKEMKQDDVISQSFIASKNNLNKVMIELDPKKEDVNAGGEIVVGIKKEDDITIKEETITRNYFREDNKYVLSFDKQNDSEGKTYKVYIKFHDLNKKERFVSVMRTEKSDENVSTYINEKKQDFNIVTQEFYKNQSKETFFYVMEAILIITIAAICVYIYFKKDIRPERIFLITVPVVALFFIIAMPTFKNHDELFHWYRVYEVSTGHLIERTSGTEMPESVRQIATDDWTSINYGTIKNELGTDLNKQETNKIYSETDAVYSFVQYIPQAIGAFICRIIVQKPMLIAYAARLFNLIFATIMLYWAIKLIPFGKKILLACAYIPIAIEGFASLSPDTMTISIAFLFIAYVLKLAFDEKSKVGKKEISLLSIMALVIALSKIVYIPLVGLMFIIPKEKFKNKTNKNKIIVLSIICVVAVAVNLIWLKVASTYLQNFREGDSSYQVKYVLQNPINYMNTMLHTANTNAENYLRTTFGGDLGWGELTKLNALVPYVIALIFMGTTILDNSIKEKFKKHQKVIILLITLAILGLIFTSLYVQWTSVKATSIAGIQGRYFIPILPLIGIVIGSIIKTKSNYDENKFIKTIAITETLMYIYVIMQIIISNI